MPYLLIYGVLQAYDGSRTILGCLTTVGSAFCAVGTAVTEGALAFVCATVWVYAIDRGAADCLNGALDAVAAHLGKDKE